MSTTTITDQPNRHEYVAAAAQTDFTFDFQIFNGVADILVEIDGVEEDSFSVILSGDEGGTIRLSNPLVGGEDVVLQRDLAVERISQFPDAGPLPRSSLNNELNRLVGLVQDLHGHFDRMETALGYTDDDVVELLHGGLTAGFGINLLDTPEGVEISCAIDAEYIRDTVGVLLEAGAGIELTVNDAGDKLTIASTGGGGGGGLTTEDVRDTVAAFIQNGTGIDWTHDDTGNTLTPTITGSYSDEQARDAIGAALTAGSGLIKTVDDGGDTITLAIDPARVLQIPVMAGAMTPRTTGGCGQSSVEVGANKIMVPALDFGASSDQFAQFAIPMPKQWDEGTLTFEPIWTATSGAGDVIWSLQAVALSNDDAIDSAFGAAVSVTDTLLAANDLHRGPTSGALTVGGAPAAEDIVVFQVFRDGDAAGDTLTATARLIGIRLKLTLAALDDA